VLLDLHGARVVVVGGGRVAARKIEGLLHAGALVTVVAPDVDGEVRRHETELVAILERPYERADLDGARLVLVATDRPEVNAAVAADAAAAGLWVNAADDPAHCTFILPAIARAGRVTVTVSTAGSTPATSGYVRDRIAAEVLTDDLVAVVDEIARERAELRAGGASSEGIDWRARIAELLARGPAPPSA
jgi:siroheme synthase-like protein